MTEGPVYEYVRGQGWVPGGHPTVSCISDCGQYRLTLIERRPVNGESFFADDVNASLQTLLEEIKTYNFNYDWGGRADDYLNPARPDDTFEKIFPKCKLVVFVKERII